MMRRMVTSSIVIIYCINVLLLPVASLSIADEDKKATYNVVGFGECVDCKENNFKTSQAFTGLHVSIDCKLKSGEMKRIAESELDDKGKFMVPISSKHIINHNNDECYAQLHSAAAIPCPSYEGLEASKIVFKSKTTDNKHIIFGPAKKLRFLTALCTSEFLWPHYKYPPLPKTLPWKKKMSHLYKSKPKLKPVVKPLEPKLKPKRPKYFDKPKYGYFPPMPPAIPRT